MLESIIHVFLLLWIVPFSIIMISHLVAGFISIGKK